MGPMLQARVGLPDAGQTLGLAGYLSPRTNRRFVILDWDGTLNVGRPYLSGVKKLKLLPGAPRLTLSSGTWRWHRRRDKLVGCGQRFF